MLAGLIFCFQPGYCEETYQKVRIFNLSPSVIQSISEAGIPLDHVTGKAGEYIDIIASKSQIERLDNNFEFEILISDLVQYMLSKNIPALSRNFPLGSMQGNYTWDELNNRFDELRDLYGSIISDRHIIGQSVEGHDIWAFKVSDNPAEDEQEPEVLFTALTHAREPLSMMNLFYFVQIICEKYGIDPEFTYLVDSREMWFIPVMNPDGYIYNESYAPEGGGMHRKNRLDTNCGNSTQRGVDLNRNYSYGWGNDDSGSSPDPCSETYRGVSAFSEPETDAVREFIQQRFFMNIFHYHTFSNVYIHPYGSGAIPNEPDLTSYKQIGNELARFNGYAIGTGYETIGYTVNGDAVDWTYGNQDIITFTPEIGSYDDYFWPSENRIVPLCQEQLHPNKIFSFIAGNDIILMDVSFEVESFLPGELLTAQLNIQNRGLMNSDGDISIILEPMNSFIALESDSIGLGSIDARDNYWLGLGFSVSDSATRGIKTGFITTISDNSSFPRQDSIHFFIGIPDTIFIDNFESGIINWQLDGEWGLIDSPFAGNWALSDSPEGDYGNSQSTTATLNIDFDFSYFHGVYISYVARWDIETYYDFVQFQAFIPEEGWVSLKGKYTTIVSGQGIHPVNQGYHGNSDEWIKEIINLEQLGELKPTLFRFIQKSDNYTNGDGFSFDNFMITAYPSFLLGDLNSDHALGIIDIIQMADMLATNEEPDSSQFTIIDLDNNDIFNLFDLFLLINLIMEF